MRLAIGLTAMALLGVSVAQGQRLEPSRFSHRTDETRLITPVAFIAQDTTRCDHSVPRFLGQFLAGTFGGAAAAVLFFGISGPTYGDSGEGDPRTFTRLQIAAQAVGAAVGAWTAAPRNCRAFAPALIGSVVPGIPFWADSGGGDANAGILLGTLIFGIPLQAMTATLAQTLAR